MPVTVPEYGFPTKYDENYLVLLVRDPYCIFSYWEFSEEQMNIVAKEFKCAWGEVPLVIRVYDLTGLNFTGGNAHGYFDISIHPLANNFYVKAVNANNSYCVDLGVRTADGRFITLLRSNVVQTPRDSLADGSGTVMADLLDRLGFAEKETDSDDHVFSSAVFSSSEGVYINSGEKNRETPSPEEE